MSYYFIITGSVIINWLSESNSDISIFSKKLFTELKQISSVDEGIKVVAVEETDNFIKEISGQDVWIYRFIRAHYDLEKDNCGGNEIASIVNLADLKSKTFDKIIIINGSNVYDDEQKLKTCGNVVVLSEKEAYDFVKRNCGI